MERKTQWLLCPRCASKTRVQVRADTLLEKFPLFCPKCRYSVLVNLKNLQLHIIEEPDAE